MNDTCRLVNENKVVNKYGDLISNQKTSIEVFCKVKSIRQTEFYQASAVGMKPEIVLEVRQEDYSDETIVIYNGIEYKVLRTYIVGKKVVELILSKDIYGTS